MKRDLLTLVVALPLAVACSGVPEPPPAAPAVAEILPRGHAGESGPTFDVSLHPDGGRIDLTIGPIDLPAAQARAHNHGDSHGGDVAGHAMVRTPLLEAALPGGAWLTGFGVELVDAAGNPLPQTLLHHVNLILPDRAELFRPIMQRLVAAGEETDPIVLPWPLGIPAPAGQPLLAYAMLHNPTSDDLGPVTLRMSVRFAEGRRLAVQPFFIDVSPPPGSASWDLPAGRSSRTWEGSPMVSGRILGVGGHLHQYGTELVLEDVTAGKVLFRLRPETAEDGTLIGVDRRRFLSRLGLPIRADHVYRITATYDNPTGRTIPDGAMGAIGGIFRPSARAWPAPDLDNPLLVRDLEMLTLTASAAGHAH